MTQLIKPILIAFVTSDSVKRLICDLLETLAESTDSQMDDEVVKLVRNCLFPNWGKFKGPPTLSNMKLITYILEKMEALLAVAIACVTGGAALNRRLHERINNVHDRVTGVDRRIDDIELNVASNYVSKQEISEVINRVEDRMIRIEDKIDQYFIRKR